MSMPTSDAIHVNMTLYEVAHGVKYGEKIPKGSLPRNLAAHDIIKNDEERVCISKIALCAGVVLFTLGITFLIIYSQFPPTYSLRTIHDVIDLSQCAIFLGIIFIGVGSFVLYRDSKRLEEARTKPIKDISDRIDEDLTKIYNRDRKSLIKEARLYSDLNRISEVLIADQSV